MKSSDTVKLILGKLIPKPEEDPGDKPQDKQEEYMSAAEEILSAIKKDDAEGLAEALHAFVELCEESEEPEASEELDSEKE